MKPSVAVCAVILLAMPPLQACSTQSLSEKPIAAASAREAASYIGSMDVETTADAGVWNGVRYVKLTGVAYGHVKGKDIAAVRNLKTYIEDGAVRYESRFELIVPAVGEPANQVIYIDSENRGGAISQSALGGFLQTHATSYARIQWQTGYSKGVPADAQGLGLVIMRDFARYLAGRTLSSKKDGELHLLMDAKLCSSHCVVGYAAYPKMILGGISQSAWFVNSFIAEGFNVDPVTGGKVFDAAIAIDGLGNWLAINQMGAAFGAPQSPYVAPNGPPMDRKTLLRRPKADPLYIDVANYTDFYRLRAGLTSVADSNPTFRRYDWPSPHANGLGAACNGGKPALISPLRYPAYFRALVLNVEKAIGVASAAGAPGLPPSTIFTLGPAPQASPLFNPLPGADVRVPRIDAEGWPVGGVRFPEAVHPTGRPEPASMPPSDTSSISNTCGNSSGWMAWDLARLTARYGSKAGYLARYAEALDRLIGQGFVLPEDRAGLLKTAETYWPAS